MTELDPYGGAETRRKEPRRLPSRRSVRVAWTAGAMTTVLLSALAVLLVVHVRDQQSAYLAIVKAHLTALATHRAEAVETWVRDRKERVELIASFPTIAHLTGAEAGPPFPYPPEVGAASHVQQILRGLPRSEEADGLAVLGPAGDLLLVDPPRATPEDAALEIARRVDPTGTRVVLSTSGLGPTLVVFATSLPDTPECGGSCGAVAEWYGAEQWLFPLLRRGATLAGGRWLLVSGDSESPEVFGVGDEAAWLTRALDAEPVREALTSAFAGRSAVGESRREDGAPLLAAARPVTGTPWALVAVMPATDALAAHRAGMWASAAVFGIALVSMLLTGALYWRVRRSELERELLGARMRYAVLIERSGEGILFLDKAGKVVEANPAACALLDRPAEAVVGRTLDEFLVAEQGADTARRQRDATLGKRSAVFEINVRRGDGAIFPAEITIRPIESDGARLDLVFLRDVSERRRQRAELEQRNEFIATILDNVPIGLAVHTRDTGRVVYMNVRFEEICGWPRSALTSVDEFFERVIPDELERATVERRVHEDLASGDRRRMRWDSARITARSGEERFITAASFSVPGQQLMISTIQDVSRRHRAERQLQHQDRLAAVGQLAAGIAHDFNNMLQAVTMNAELAATTVDPDHPVRANAGAILEQTKRAAELIRQILDFARRTVIVPRIVNLAELVHDTVKMLRSTIPERVTIDYTVEPGHYPVLADPTQLQQVITNLAVNANDAMPGGGRLHIRLEAFQLEPSETPPDVEMRAGRWVELSLLDTGHGMPPEVRKRVFEPFFSTKERSHGTGLGLAQVYGIVKQHGGFIDVDSAEGQGTSFVLYLPMRDQGPAVADQERDISVRAAGRGQVVLVVEDDEAILEVTRDLLTQLGYEVLTANHGRDALTLMESRSDAIDLVIADVVMPHMGGMELARELRALSCSHPVMLMTGYPVDQSTEEQIELGITEVVAKPFTMAALAAAIQRALGTSR